MLGLVNRSTGYSCVSVRVLRSKACGALKRQSHPTRAEQVTAKDFVCVCVCAYTYLLVSVLYTITIVVKQSHQQHMHAHIQIHIYVYVFTQEHNNRKRAEGSVLSLFILYIKYYLPKWSTTIFDALCDARPQC